MNSRLLGAALFLLAANCAIAQQSSTESLSVESIYGDKAKDIVWLDAVTGNKEILVKSSQLIPAGSGPCIYAL